MTAQSDTREYILAAESNKEAAAAIARDTASSMSPPTMSLQPHQYLWALELENKQITLIDLVQSLGEYINDENEKIRARAVTYLTATISGLSPTFLTRQQVQVLTDFLCARIEDGGAIEGLSKLQASSRFTKDMAQSVAKA
jgi:DNA repair/transcription protein MET18/MMS19